MSAEKVVVEEVQDQEDSDDEIPALENEATQGNLESADQEVLFLFFPLQVKRSVKKF